jgi:hypothetical protein
MKRVTERKINAWIFFFPWSLEILYWE